MTKLKNFSVKLTKDQFDVIAPLMTKAGMRWGSGAKIEDWNPYVDSTFHGRPSYWYMNKGLFMSFYTLSQGKGKCPIRTYLSLLHELKGIVAPAKRKKPKVSNPIEYKVGEHFPDWESLTPYEEGTILEKGDKVVYVFKGDDNRLKSGTIVRVNEDNHVFPFILPSADNGKKLAIHTSHLAPLPAGKPKATKFKRKWTIKKTATSNDGIRIEEDVVFISLPNVSDIEIAREHLKLLYGKIGSAMKTIDNELKN